MIMLRRWSVEWRKNDHVREVVSFMEGACYIGGQFKGGKMLQKWSL